MKPIIVNFLPYSRERLRSIRQRRDSDLLNGLAVIPKKKKASTPKTKKPKKLKTPPTSLTPEALAFINSLPEEQRRSMLETFS